MYSNFITPPDFVTDDFHTLTVINASEADILLLTQFCQYSDVPYNIYMYRDEMNNNSWLTQAIEKSSATIIHDINTNWHKFFSSNSVYYYGTNQYACPAVKVNNILDYFAKIQTK